MSTLICQNEQRREQVRAKPKLNGLDYLEVSNDQTMLTVYFLGKAPQQLTEQNCKDHFKIEGGRRVHDIHVIDTVKIWRDPDPELDDWVKLKLNRYGDFSIYTLRLVNAGEWIDPRYDHLDFTFKINCPSDLDCKAEDACPPETRQEPEINYLAKDYASFRQLILDRLALVMPEWRERHVPDLGITLVEVLAYVGDYLSYYQDAVATEAYLDTARQRISVRRHARLVDYLMHEGCNARAWVCVQVSTTVKLDPEDVLFVTRLPGAKRVLALDELRNVPSQLYAAFEPLIGKRSLNLDVNRIRDESDFKNMLLDPKHPLHFSLRSRVSSNLQRLLVAYGRCDLRIRSANHDSDKTQLINQFKAEFESKKNVCAILIVTVSTNAAKEWTVAGYNDAGEFKTVLISDTNDGLAKELKKAEGANRNKLIMLATSKLGRTPYGKTKDIKDPLLDQALGNEWKYLTGDDFLLYSVHSTIHFYTWKNQECCLPRGATRATLLDKWVDASLRASSLQLRVGDVLLFEEVIGPRTGDPADADPTHRHAVRLTKVEPNVDSLDDTPVVEIEWSPEDALPFPLCVSAITDAEHGCVYREDISVAHGNVVLVDHGRTIDGSEDLGVVSTAHTQAGCDCAGHPSDVTLIAERFEPQLAQSPLTFSQPVDFTQPASQALQQDPSKALPQLTLHSLPGNDQWTPHFDLLGSGRDDRDFVVEIDNEGRANLRFGDDECGRAPEAEMQFSALYRIGNGKAGNVGGEAIHHLVYRRQKPDGIDGVRNPLPANGGADPEPISEVKLFAPSAFRKELQRAITPDDYARITERTPKVQRAAAVLCWTGSWHEMQVAIDPVGSEELSDDLRLEIERDLYPFRRIGYDLRIMPARYVSLDIAMDVCVQPDYLHGHVKAALLGAFSNRILPDGKPGFFHPDKLTFGDGIYLSKLVAVAQAVEGVESVGLTKLQRQFERPNQELKNGVLPLGPLEVARCDNDPSFPEHGKFELNVMGGR